MRVCFIANNIGTKTGLGRMVESIADRLVQRGHQVGFVVSEGESQHPLLRIRFRLSLSTISTTLLDLLRMRRFVNQYDVIVCFDVQPAGIFAHIATFGRSDVIVVHSLGTYSLFTKKQRFKNKLIEAVYKKSDRVFLINTFVKRKIEASKNAFQFGSNVSFVGVGVDTQLFHKLVNSKSPELDEFIISVGAIKPRKGQLDSIKAFNRIKERYPNLKYVLVGSITDAVSYYDDIKSFIKLNGIEDRIIFLQDIDDSRLIELYSGALFFVLTPTSSDTAIEGFGMVYIESALCGLTAIGTKNTGAEAAIVNGETGLLVEQSDVENIAKAMEKLLRDASYRDQLASQARTLALTYDWKYVVDLYELELSKLVKRD